LQLDVQRRVSRGVSLHANYTFSKLEDDFGVNHCDGCGAAAVTVSPSGLRGSSASRPRPSALFFSICESLLSAQVAGLNFN